ncbi:MAG: hypothetical protein IKI42_02985 [Clostridia bacterium]|nr:hypothetical protein [Clostridia bacterium]
MKDDKIRLLMTEISDKYIDRYREILDKKAAETAAASASAATSAATSATRGARHGRQRTPFVWRAIAAGVAALFFLAGGLLLGKYLHRDKPQEPDVSPIVTPAATAAPTATAMPSATAAPSEAPVVTAPPADTVSPTATATLTATVTPAATPALTPTVTLALTPTATPTAAVTATAAPPPTPAVTPTATSESNTYIETRLEIYEVICEDEPAYNGLMDFDYDDNIIFSCQFPDCLYVAGYAYNSGSPLKEVYYRINDGAEEYVCTGNYYARNDVAEQAGYIVDNAVRSGFGTDRDPLKLTGLSLVAGVFRLHLMARFENGTETEIASPVLVIDRETDHQLYEYSEGTIGVIIRDRDVQRIDEPYDTHEFFPLYGDCTLFDLGELNLSLFSRCEIEYYTAPDWQPFVEGAMTEPAFISLKQGADIVWDDGADKSRVLAWTTLAAPSPSDPPHPIYSDSLVRRTAVIDLSDCTFSDLSPVSLSGYPSTSGPVYLSELRLYFRAAP